MSHYVVLVIGENPESQLEPFDENLECEPYLVGDVDEAEKQRMLDFYERTGEKFNSFEECYAVNGNNWNGNRYQLDNDGVWREYSTYNPDSKWDWYELGGRWSGGFIKLKDGCQGVVGCGSWANGYESGVDQAYKRDIDFDKIDRAQFIPYAVLYEGEWISRGDMGWWAITLKEHYSSDDWHKKVWELIDSCSDDTLFSFYDLHI